MDLTTAKNKALNIVHKSTGYYCQAYKVLDKDLKGKAASTYNPLTKQIYVDTAVCEERGVDLTTALIHEYLHAIENDIENPTLTTQDSQELFMSVCKMKDKKAQGYALQLLDFLTQNKNAVLEKEPDEIVDEALDLLQNCKDALSDESVRDSCKEFIQTYKKVGCKIINTIEFNAYGGHTETWLELANDVLRVSGIDCKTTA